MSYAAMVNVKLETLTCSSCAIAFSVPEEWLTNRRSDGKQFFCPNGHSLSYHETEAARLKKELEAERRRLEFARNEARAQREESDRLFRRLSAAKGQMTKLRNRIGNGVCPCCNRSFANLQRHMVTKHPKFKITVSTEEGQS